MSDRRIIRGNTYSGNIPIMSTRFEVMIIVISKLTKLITGVKFPYEGGSGHLVMEGRG